MVYTVKLPGMNWFNYKKIYTGSLGTDPLRGSLACTTFHYRVRIVSDEQGNEQLVAVCFFQLPWNCRTNMGEFTTGVFEASEFGIEVAGNWILSQYFRPIGTEAPKQIEERRMIEQMDMQEDVLFLGQAVT